MTYKDRGKHSSRYTKWRQTDSTETEGGKQTKAGIQTKRQTLRLINRKIKLERNWTDIQANGTRTRGRQIHRHAYRLTNIK